MTVRLVMIADTHQRHSEMDIPDGDILIHAGDFSMDWPKTVEMKQAYHFFDWLAEQPHKHKVLIAGNHDYIFEKIQAVRKTLHPSIHYLEGYGIVLDRVKIWGGPWTPRFFDWAFNVDRGEAIRRYWDWIPRDIDVLVPHGPPFGILDDTPSGPVGCEELAEVVDKIQPKVHVFGHIHPQYGSTFNNWTRFLNVSVVDSRYKLANRPITYDLEMGDE